MKINDWIRVLIWGVLLIACLTFGLIGLTKHRTNNNYDNEPIYNFEELEYNE